MRTIPLAALAALLTVLPSAGQSPSPTNDVPGNVTLTGTVSCSKFGASRPSQKGFSQAEAIHMCISQGYSYVLVVGKRVYPLEGDGKQFSRLVGEKVTISGRLNPEKPVEKETFYDGTLQPGSIAVNSK
jgi:hypothetical protein